VVTVVTEGRAGSKRATRAVRGESTVAAAPVRIRRALVDDAAAVAAVLNEAIEDGRFTILDRPFSADEEAAYIAGLGERGLIHVAEDPGGRVVGAQTIAPLDESVGALQHVATMGTWVAGDRRRRGVGCALFAASARAARALGYAKILTELRADNAASLAYHLSLGFTVVGTARAHVRIGGREIDAVFVERLL
jgi:L-amino acid N-acyltransferase YncA